MVRRGLIILISFCVLSENSQFEQFAEVVRLRKALGITIGLMRNRIVRPVLHENSTTHVTVSVDVSDIVGVQLEGCEASIKAQVCTSWTAETLRWDPANFNGLKSLSLGSHEVWVPDIQVFNRVNLGDSYTRVQTPIRLFYNGTLGFCRFSLVSVSCDTDLYAFPSDRHKCSVDFGSSTYGIEHVNLIPQLRGSFGQLTDRAFSEWRLEAADFHLVKGGEGDYFDYKLQLDLIIQRKFSYHIYRFVLPLTLGTSLTLLFCWLPLSGPKRFFLPLVGLVLMTLTAFRYSSMLSSSSRVPLFLTFSTGLMCFTAMVVFLALVGMALDASKKFRPPSHPLLDRLLRSTIVASYLLSEDMDMALAGAKDASEADDCAEQPGSENNGPDRNWSRLLLLVQRASSVIFLALYLGIYYFTLGSK